MSDDPAKASDLRALCLLHSKPFKYMCLGGEGCGAGASDMQNMDTNTDGVVDESEFEAGGGSKQEFAKYDLNGDKVLDADDMDLQANECGMMICASCVNSPEHEGHQYDPVESAEIQKDQLDASLSLACCSLSR